MKKAAAHGLSEVRGCGRARIAFLLGHARNPWDPTRITGGSSAGTAAAVAYGAIPAGLGSDTGGSLRLPAATAGLPAPRQNVARSIWRPTWPPSLTVV